MSVELSAILSVTAVFSIFPRICLYIRAFSIIVVRYRVYHTISVDFRTLLNI